MRPQRLVTAVDLGLEGKRVLVTGGSKGIGYACGESFARAGCRVVLVSRDAATLDRAAARARQHASADVVTRPADLSNADERERIAAEFPDIDVLVNNAGAIPGGDLSSFTLDSWQAAWNLKVFGYIHLTKLYLQQMSERRGGVIVNVIGSAGRAPRGDYVCGATGNAALIAFTEAVGGASPDVGVRVLGCNPGPTATARLLGRPESDLAADLLELRTRLPAVRVAEPAGIAELVTFLSSARARTLSGVVIDSDHGQLRRPTS